MQVKINSIHFNADSKLESLIESKVQKLNKFHDILNAEVFLRVENVQNRENKIAEIRLYVPGADLFAKKQSDSFEKSTDESVEALRKQIIKLKEKKSQ